MKERIQNAPTARTVGSLKVSANAAVATIAAFLVLCLSACQPNQNRVSPQTPPQTPYLVHVVQYPGETLSIIANWYTGSPRNWQLVMDANPGLDPRRIRLGDTIRIPRELLSREDPLPRSALGSAQRRDASAARDDTPTASATPEAPEPVQTSDEVGSEEASNSESVMGEILAPSESQSSEAVVADPSEPVSATVESAPGEDQVAAEAAAAAAEEAAAASAAAEGEASSAPPAEMRIKSRDELLKELLEE